MLFSAVPRVSYLQTSHPTIVLTTKVHPEATHSIMNILFSARIPREDIRALLSRKYPTRTYHSHLISPLNPICPARHNALANINVRLPPRHIVPPLRSHLPLHKVPLLGDATHRPEHRPLIAR
jgi:hypothetical protein